MIEVIYTDLRVIFTPLVQVIDSLLDWLNLAFYVHSSKVS